MNACSRRLAGFAGRTPPLFFTTIGDIMNSGTVTDAIIAKVGSLTSTNVVDMKKEIQILEPNFYKWAKESIKEDINSIKFSGVTIHGDDALRSIGAILLQAKTEGFLIALMAQDREWADKLFVDHDKEESGVPFSEPIAALMSGKLDKKFYEKMEKELTAGERKDPNHWKNKAIAAFKKNSEMKGYAHDVRRYVKDQRKEAEDKRRKNDGTDQAPSVDIEP